MTAVEVVTHLCAVGADSPIEIFLYLAGHASDLRLADGQRLNDNTDFRAFLLELADALQNPERNG